MSRATLEKVESESEFALGLGVAIGMFIALFAVAIVLFVIEQGSDSTPASRAVAGDTGHAAPPARTPAGSTTSRE
jgi:hypothetical protein